MMKIEMKDKDGKIVEIDPREYDEYKKKGYEMVIRKLRFDLVDKELSDRLRKSFKETLKGNLEKFIEDTKKYGYRPEDIVIF